ncbi:MAG TPA: PH domain-containing protein [Phycisphaeraceae bacterium]
MASDLELASPPEPRPHAAGGASPRCATPSGAGPADGQTSSPPHPAAALLPAQLFQPGEIIILLLKPSPWFILLAPLKTLVALALLILGVITLNRYFPLGLENRDLVLLGVALIGVRLFWQFLEWLSRIYILTDQRMIRIQGVLRVAVLEVRLNQIQHTELLFTLRERLFGLGTVAFATAGTAWTEAYWRMVARPLEVHQRVVETLRRYRH